MMAVRSQAVFFSASPPASAAVAVSAVRIASGSTFIEASSRFSLVASSNSFPAPVVVAAAATCLRSYRSVGVVLSLVDHALEIEENKRSVRERRRVAVPRWCPGSRHDARLRRGGADGRRPHFGLGEGARGRRTRGTSTTGAAARPLHDGDLCSPALPVVVCCNSRDHDLFRVGRQGARTSDGRGSTTPPTHRTRHLGPAVDCDRFCGHERHCRRLEKRKTCISGLPINYQIRSKP